MNYRFFDIFVVIFCQGIQQTEVNKKNTLVNYAPLINRVTATIGRAKNKLYVNQKHPGLPIEYKQQAASDLIRVLLSKPEPCMISRLGAVELRTLVTYLNIQRKPKFPLEKQISYLTRQTPKYCWSALNKLSMSQNAGFFPATEENLARFARLMLEEIQNIDVLGSWCKDELAIANLLFQAKTVSLRQLRPWEHERPWSEILEGKTVLVIHPFDVSIQNQYRQREHLFQDRRVLPQFELKTFKAVQSIAENKTPFDSWFAALDWMYQQVLNIEFDVAIIGAGAYGLPLASYIKKIGKKSVHLGGVTQLMFGIKGKRWEEQNYLQKLANEYWVRPLPSEIPSNSRYVEGGCYW